MGTASEAELSLKKIVSLGVGGKEGGSEKGSSDEKKEEEGMIAMGAPRPLNAKLGA